MTNACEETNQTIADMENNVDGFSSTSIPQLEGISNYIK